MTKIIQTSIEANGDVHLDFSGFAGRDCEIEEDRIRRELISLGLDVAAKYSAKSRNIQSEPSQQRISIVSLKS
jgi:hypothetical protein